MWADLSQSPAPVQYFAVVARFHSFAFMLGFSSASSSLVEAHLMRSFLIYQSYSSTCKKKIPTALWHMLCKKNRGRRNVALVTRLSVSL